VHHLVNILICAVINFAIWAVFPSIRSTDQAIAAVIGFALGTYFAVQEERRRR
jgi:hypothetical protein